MAYELFSRKRTHGGPPAVTVTKNSTIVINASAVEHYFSKRRYVHVYWDEDNGKVGLKPLAKYEDQAYRVNVSPKGKVAAFSGAAFLRHAGYKPGETRSFPAT